MNDDLGSHISRQYDRELEEIRSRVLEMGGLVEEQLQRVLNALSEGDAEVAESVSNEDYKVNELELLIDEECTQILAKRQPAAGDLRLIVATTKSVRDLERIGDEVERVARMVKHSIETNVPANYYKGLLSLGEKVKKLLHSTLNTFARMDSRSAVKNMRDDQVVDEEYDRILRALIDLMTDQPKSISKALDVMWAARSLERIGDHCINICEYVIYQVEGEDVRHVDVDEISDQVG